MPPEKDEKAVRTRRLDFTGIFFNALLPFTGMLVALLIGAIMLLILKVNPLTAYAQMVNGAFGSVTGITQTLVKATPLLLVGLGICIAFRASVINIGAEGQIVLGALGATAWALGFRSWPS